LNAGFGEIAMQISLYVFGTDTAFSEPPTPLPAESPICFQDKSLFKSVKPTLKRDNKIEKLKRKEPSPEFGKLGIGSI